MRISELTEKNMQNRTQNTESYVPVAGTFIESSVLVMLQNIRNFTDVANVADHLD